MDGLSDACSAAFHKILESLGISEGSLRQYAGEYPTKIVGSLIDGFHSAPSFFLSKSPLKKLSQEIEPRETITFGCFAKSVACL